jgi:transketolase
MIPNMDVWRPADTMETLVAWAHAVERKDGPSSLCLSRQNLPYTVRSAEQIAAIRKGGYVLSEAKGPLKAVLIATGSEVELALKAQTALALEGIHVRVVSMPSTNLFDRQDSSWHQAVLPHGVVRVAIEAGVSDGWYKYVGLDGAVVGLNHFGESAPASLLFKEFGFTVENVVATVKAVA